MAQSFNFVGQVLQFLTPPPVVTSPDYEGLEFNWKIFVFRPALFKVEALLLLGVALYVAAFFFGSARNAKRANTWLDAHLPLLSQQFSRPTIAGLVSDGYSDFFNFSTGRRGVTSLHTVFTLKPRHDPLQMLFMFGRSLLDLNYNPGDEIELDFKLAPAPNTPPFVFAIVAKGELSKVKEGRWDLTFTRTTENPQLGTSFGVMSEFADVTENLFKQHGTFALSQALNDPTFRPYLRSLSVTDQPRERPLIPIPAEHRERHVILSLKAPPASHAADTVPLVKIALNLCDIVDKLALRPETKMKLRKTREELDETIKKEAEAEAKEEAELNRLAEKRKADEDRMSKLSATEQKKILERDRKRALRKSQGKMVKK